MDENLADETACKMEHGLSHEALDRIIKFTEFVERCPHSDKGWLKGFGFFCKNGTLEKCNHCQNIPEDRCE
jgi:DtxR family Mn-dependent transcriptional regulator